jgi:hypothetical protein
MGWGELKENDEVDLELEEIGEEVLDASQTKGR